MTTKMKLAQQATEAKHVQYLTKADLHAFETRMTIRFVVGYAVVAIVIIAGIKLL